MSSGSQIKLGAPSTSNANRTLWIAIALGAVAAVANLIFVSSVESGTISVLKAHGRLTVGSRVSSSDFTAIDISGQDLKEMKALVVESGDLKAFTETPLAETLEPGQILMQSSFGLNGNRGFRNAIKPDERAIALSVKDESSAVAYFVQKGARVDVWVNTGGGMENIIPDALVKAVGEAAIVGGDSGQGSRYRTVTVVVPRESVKDILFKLDASKNGVVLALAGSTP